VRVERDRERQEIQGRVQRDDDVSIGDAVALRALANTGNLNVALDTVSHAASADHTACAPLTGSTEALEEVLFTCSSASIAPSV